MNQFLNKMSTKNTFTWNGAISNSSSGNSCLDYFAKCGSYRFRSCEEVNADIASIFGENPLTAMKIVFYNRMITRKPKGFNNESDNLQKGQGQRDECIKSLAWLENNHPEILYKNLWLVPVVGRWSDLWYDSPSSKFYYYINSQKVYELIKSGLKSDYHRPLIAKYLPKIRSKRNITNDRHRRLNTFAKGLCSYLGWSEADYRKFKSGPINRAHLYQRFMCANAWTDLDFNMIPGKALFNLLNRTGKDFQNALQRHNMEEKYIEWIKTQPVAKFTGYPYELYQAAKCRKNLAQTYTLNRQFEGLLEKAKNSISPELLKRGVLCALDTSGSMCVDYCMTTLGCPAPIDICVGLGLYFSNLIEGHFKNHVIMFDDNSRFLKLNGNFCEQVDQINEEATAWGGTNFQSVINEIVRVRRQNPKIPVEDYPEVLLVVSDMEFNPTGTNKTNYENAMRKLRNVGLPNMTIIWWQVNGRFTGDVPSTISDPGTVLISGFDGAIVTTILSGMEKVVDKTTGETRSKTPDEVMMECLDQEILNKIQI